MYINQAIKNYFSLPFNLQRKLPKYTTILHDNQGVKHEFVLLMTAKVLLMNFACEIMAMHINVNRHLMARNSKIFILKICRKKIMYGLVNVHNFKL